MEMALCGQQIRGQANSGSSKFGVRSQIYRQDLTLGTSALPARCREFAPAADLLSCAHKKEGKESAPAAWPCGSARCSNLSGRAQLTALRSVQTRGAKLAFEVASRRPANSALLAHAEGGLRRTRLAAHRLEGWRLARSHRASLCREGQVLPTHSRPDSRGSSPNIRR
jgi:hypothetical protein